MRSIRTSNVLAVAVLCAAAGAASASSFTAGNIVIMRVDNTNPLGSGAIFLDEYTKTGINVGNTLAVDSTSADAVSVPGAINHDRHLHRSTDGQFLTFTAYGATPSTTDYSTSASSSVPRVVGVVNAGGSVDLSTRLTNAYDNTSVRGAFTTNGTDIWVAGDNGSGGTPNGGLQYTTKGSSTSNNLSQVQALGGPKTPDNVRDVSIFNGQLYDCSGSSASIGKGVLSVGSGTPITGSQTATFLNTDGISVSSFALLDLDASIPGVDTLYAANTGVTKYIKQSNGTWIAKGVFAFTGIEQIIAQANGDGSVTIFAGSPNAVGTLTDNNAFTSTLSGSATTIVTASAGYTLGGIEFTPVPAPATLSLLIGAAPLVARRRRR